MVYGIDVDGVLTDIWLYQMNKAIPYFKKHNIELKHEKEYDIKDIFECTDKQREKFWSIYIWEYCLRLKMTDGAAERKPDLYNYRKGAYKRKGSSWVYF